MIFNMSRGRPPHTAVQDLRIHTFLGPGPGVFPREDSLIPAQVEFQNQSCALYAQLVPLDNVSGNPLFTSVCTLRPMETLHTKSRHKLKVLFFLRWTEPKKSDLELHSHSYTTPVAPLNIR